MMMLLPLSRRLIARPIQCPRNHLTRRWHTSRNPEAKREKKQRGRLFFDRDYHVHLGGAIPPSFIAEWIREGRLTLNDQIPDLEAAASSPSEGGGDGGIPTIAVRDALRKYRGIAVANEIVDSNLESDNVFLSAYDAPPYDSLTTFLTLYRAYSRRDLLREHASRIARGGLVHPRADVRASVPPPNDETGESPSTYARRALEEIEYFRSCLLPDQELFVTFPRQTFNASKNCDHFASFVDLLESATEENDSEDAPTSFASRRHLSFDFAGQPLPLVETLPLLERLREAFPSSFMCYHHGELCPLPFSDRVRDTALLLPHVDRVGHALCLGLAVLGIDPDGRRESEGATDDSSSEVRKQRIANNKRAAYRCLRQMAASNIGIEVSPTCNITLGGARNETILRRYVKEFLHAGVDVFVGTDDPGFLGTTLKEEAATLKGVDE